MEGIFQSFKGPQGAIMYLDQGKFIFARDYRRGEVVFIRCQDKTCGAKGQILDYPNNPGLQPCVIKLDQSHNHLPHVYN